MLHCLPSGSGSGGKQQRQKKQLALPFRALSWDAEVHAALFVHRVDGLPKGLYFLVRNEDHLDELKKATRPDFKWEKPEGRSDDLPLYELGRGDCQQISKALSCHQDIASDGCFSLGMVARFEPALRDKVHELLGLRGSRFQSLYHFTVGGPVLDMRIMSLPAYPGPDMDA
ncbi:unnamed protein product [Linum tenue]|uniref:Uncharacterized protein n=1 Tax=Linum tenue TaxID=586396 RepID=A0AAV0RRH0_9ROSI|nr:unnamed protein product [Linum tenue]